MRRTCSARVMRSWKARSSVVAWARACRTGDRFSPPNKFKRWSIISGPFNSISDDIQEGAEMSTKASKKIVPPKKQRVPIWLPLIIIAGVALIVVALIGSGSNTPASTTKPQVSAAPALRVDQEKVDLGDVPLGQTV